MESLPSAAATAESPAAAPTPWLTAHEAAQRAKVSTRSIYTAVRSGRLRSAVIGGRRSHRFRETWVDAWLESTSTPIEVTRTTTLRVAR